MYFTYILTCKDGTLYTGFTNDLQKRLHSHNNLKSGARYTKTRRPVELSYAEEFKTPTEAKKREAELKKWSRDKKMGLIKKGTTS